MIEKMAAFFVCVGTFDAGGGSGGGDEENAILGGTSKVSF